MRKKQNLIGFKKSMLEHLLNNFCQVFLNFIFYSPTLPLPCFNIPDSLNFCQVFLNFIFYSPTLSLPCFNIPDSLNFNFDIIVVF